MAKVIRASIGPLLTNIKAKVQTDLGLADPQVRIIARDPTRENPYLPKTLSGNHILLRPQAPIPQNQDWVQGAGRVATVLARVLSVICRTRLQTDVADYDEQWLTDATYGHFVLEEAVLDSLQLYKPEDGLGNLLVIQPMRLVEGGNAPTKEHLDEGWGETTLNFSIYYAANLNQSVQ